ncbi:MAG: permease [Candidatus Levyibacteriota bacterium]
MDLFYPLQLLSEWVTFDLLNLGKNTLLGTAVDFFIYDSIKILILLCVIIYIVTFIQSYLSPEKMRKFLTKKFSILGNILAALFGITTPFCSCSAIPLFMGLVKSGVPLGVTFSYLISAPMVNEVAIVLLFGLFGIKVAALYVFSGVVIAIIVGYILGKMKLEHLVEDYVWEEKIKQNTEMHKLSLNGRLNESYLDTKKLVRKIFPYLLLGIGVGAFIHGYAPEKLLSQIAGRNNLFAVPIAVLIGVPLYSNAAGTMPIVKSLIEKGLPLGTSLSFMMAVTALSLPEMIILRKVLKPKLLALYIAILAIGIMFTGYLFNAVL